MDFKITNFLNNFLDDTGLGVTDIANKLDVSQAYVSYIKLGTKTASKKFLNNLIKNYPFLKSKESELLEMLEYDKNIEKLDNIEKKKKEVLNDITNEEIEDQQKLKEVISSVDFFFNDTNVPESDKEKLLFSLQELFFEAKKRKKRQKK